MLIATEKIKIGFVLKKENDEIIIIFGYNDINFHIIFFLLLKN